MLPEHKITCPPPGAGRNGEAGQGGRPERVHQGLGRGEQTSETPGVRQSHWVRPGPDPVFCDWPKPAEVIVEIYDVVHTGQVDGVEGRAWARLSSIGIGYSIGG